MRKIQGCNCSKERSMSLAGARRVRDEFSFDMMGGSCACAHREILCGAIAHPTRSHSSAWRLRV